jgi:hypothetical protein
VHTRSHQLAPSQAIGYQGEKIFPLAVQHAFQGVGASLSDISRKKSFLVTEKPAVSKGLRFRDKLGTYQRLIGKSFLTASLLKNNFINDLL